MYSLEALYSQYRQTYNVSTDTRKLAPGCMFFALKGPNFNGNRFAAQALADGAAFAVVDEPEFAGDPRCILVPDTLKALQDLATYHREQLGIPVIAIGGSNGKTTTKELTYRILSKKFNVVATAGNLNNHIGVPLTLLSIQPGTDLAVIEMGANRIGDMDELCAIALPDSGIITNIGKEHLEGFGSLEGVALAESELYRFLDANEGLAFVNLNDEWLERMGGRLDKKITYGFGDGMQADVTGTLIESRPGIRYRIQQDDTTVEGISVLMGDYNFQNILAATTIGLYFGVDPADISDAVASYAPTNNRSQLIQKRSNTIWMDAYNANPTSMQVAIRSFASGKEPNKVLILGDMFELGDHAPAEHEALVKEIGQLNMDQVLLVGPLFSPYAGLIGAQRFNSVQEAAEYLRQHPLQHAQVFIKGSRGMKMELVVEAL